jgi:hypothetical protein
MERRISPERPQILPGGQEDFLHQIIRKIHARDQPPMNQPQT